MKIIIITIWYSAIAMISSGAQHIAAEEFKVLIHNTTAIRTSNDQQIRSVSSGVRIYALEIAKEILQSTDQKFSVYDMPLQRGLYELSRRNKIILLPLRKTEERFSKANWIGPIYRERDFLFSRANHNKDKKMLKTALPATACTISGAAFESTLAEHGIEDVIKVNSYSNCITMLILGRVDFAAMPESEFSALYPKIENVKIIKHKMIGESDVYIAVSRDVSLEDIASFRAILSAMQKDGRTAKLKEIFIDKSLYHMPEQ